MIFIIHFIFLLKYDKIKKSWQEKFQDLARKINNLSKKF